MNDDNIVGWFSLENGTHVPIKKGENKREATSKFLNKKMSRVERNKDKYDKIDKFKKRKATNKLKENDDKEFEHKKIVDFEVRDSKYIPIREGEDRDEVIKQYEERERNSRPMTSEERWKHELDSMKKYKKAMSKEEPSTREKLINFTQNNREQIDKWVSEYDEETHKKVGEKVINKEPLTAKEYFGMLGSDPKPGSVILEEFPDGENAVVANDGNWVRQSRIKEYNKNPKANQDAVYSEKDDEEWDRIIDEEKIQKFKKRKSSNK